MSLFFKDLVLGECFQSMKPLNIYENIQEEQLASNVRSARDELGVEIQFDCVSRIICVYFNVPCFCLSKLYPTFFFSFPFFLVLFEFCSHFLKSET